MLAIFAPSSAAMTCPPTAAWGPACGMEVTTAAATSCDMVLEEMKARVSGQYAAWHDPHNNGTYSVETYGGTFSTKRLTGDGKYTDKQIFTLTDSSGSCKIEACSRSQVTSVLDMGTNYCDLKMLYCGSADGCKPVKHDFTVGPESTKKHSQSSVDLSSCLKVLSSPKPAGTPVAAPAAAVKKEVAGLRSAWPKLPEDVALFEKLRSSPHQLTTVKAAGDSPCCTSCDAPLQKYFSVDVPHGFCGETCMDPKRYWLFKVFESNLTKASDDTPCSEQFTPTGGHYTNYSSTVTHGLPGVLSITLDLYAPVGAKAVA